MPIFKWNPKYNSNIKIIDEQHQKLVKSINAFYDRIKEGDMKRFVVSDTLNNLIEYANMHFAAEEKFLLQFKFPELDEHKKEHRKCTEKILELMKRFDQDDPALPLELLNFLTDWLERHILNLDNKYIQFLKQNNLVDKIEK